MVFKLIGSQINLTTSKAKGFAVVKVLGNVECPLTMKNQNLGLENLKNKHCALESSGE